MFVVNETTAMAGEKDEIFNSCEGVFEKKEDAVKLANDLIDRARYTLSTSIAHEKYCCGDNEVTTIYGSSFMDRIIISIEPVFLK